MSNISIAAALVAIFSAAVIYGTDLFCALIVRSAARGAADCSVADLLGRVHEYGDRRLPIPGVMSIIATAVATATTDGARRGSPEPSPWSRYSPGWPSTCASAHRSTRGSAQPPPAIPSRQAPETSSNAGTASSGPAPSCRPSHWPASSRSSSPVEPTTNRPKEPLSAPGDAPRRRGDFPAAARRRRQPTTSRTTGHPSPRRQ
jgi:hypothetical protein